MKHHFGLLMMQFRQAAGHTTDTLARAIGCERGVVEAVEQNRRAPPGQYMIAWSNEIRMTFEQMAFLYAKEQIKRMYMDAGIPWDPSSDKMDPKIVGLPRRPQEPLPPLNY